MSEPAMHGQASAGAQGAVAGLQHERTTLAWERTSFAVMGAGVVLGRFAATHDLVVIEPVAMVLVVIGAGLLVWAGAFYERRNETIERGHDVAHPSAARFVGLVALLTCAVSLLAGVVEVARQLG